MTDKNPDEQPTVPPQHEGTKKDIAHRFVATDENDAKKVFMIARNRLMNVNHWHEYSRPVSGTFQLADEKGNDLDRTAEKGDYFKINLPAPGNSEGDGFDWVRIETIEQRGTPDGPSETIAMRVRPAHNPSGHDSGVAHFFKESATSSFVLERNGLEVTAAVYGRNEVPNVQADHLVDKVRNAVVGAGAILGMSNVQWSNLVKGLIETRPA